MSDSNYTKLLIIVGPTAIGKSGMAIACGRKVSIEIIGADSQQCYAECAIGTAQVSPTERSGIPHHHIGVRAPGAAYDAALFAADADATIAAIVARGATPLIVGGTGLYVRALLYGLVPTPPIDPAVRRALRDRTADAAGLYAELQARDPVSAAAIHPHHTSRVLRALEVVVSTGQPLHAWHAAHPRQTLRYPTCIVGLHAPRPWLQERIAARVAQQWRDGWIDEVQRLRERYGDDAPVLRAIGYREIIAWLDRGGSIDEVQAHIVHASMRYAKRQMTYFRHQLPITQWIDVSQTPDVAANIMKQWTLSQVSA